METAVLEFLFNKVACLKETSRLVFSCAYLKTFKNTFFHRTLPVAAKHLWIAASVHKSSILETEICYEWKD